METVYLQPSAFKLNKSTGKFKLVREVDTQDIFDMTKYLLASTIKDEFISSVEDAKNFLISQLGAEDREVFACLFLNSRHRVICFEKLFYGTIDRASISPRVIVQRALIHNAAAIICIHNHPSGDALPSKNDMRVTRDIVRALALVDVRVLDHLIVAGPTVESFQQIGLNKLFKP
jgi:DNA repair protein RadC